MSADQYLCNWGGFFSPYFFSPQCQKIWQMIPTSQAGRMWKMYPGTERWTQANLVHVHAGLEHSHIFFWPLVTVPHSSELPFIYFFYFSALSLGSKSRWLLLWIGLGHRSQTAALWAAWKEIPVPLPPEHRVRSWRCRAGWGAGRVPCHRRTHAASRWGGPCPLCWAGE